MQEHRKRMKETMFFKQTANDVIKMMVSRLTKQAIYHNQECKRLRKIILDSRAALDYHQTQADTLDFAIEAANSSKSKAFNMEMPDLEIEPPFDIGQKDTPIEPKKTGKL